MRKECRAKVEAEIGRPLDAGEQVFIDQALVRQLRQASNRNRAAYTAMSYPQRMRLAGNRAAAELRGYRYKGDAWSQQDKADLTAAIRREVTAAGGKLDIILEDNGANIAEYENRAITFALDAIAGKTINGIMKALQGTISHELLHWARSMGFYNDQQWAELVSAASAAKMSKGDAIRTGKLEAWQTARGRGKTAPTYSQVATEVYSDLEPWKQQEEAVAFAMESARARYEQETPDPNDTTWRKALGSLIRAGRAIVKAIGSLAKNKQTALRDFLDAEQTNLRSGQTATQAKAFSKAGVEPSDRVEIRRIRQEILDQLQQEEVEDLIRRINNQNISAAEIAAAPIWSSIAELQEGPTITGEQAMDPEWWDKRQYPHPDGGDQLITPFEMAEYVRSVFEGKAATKIKKKKRAVLITGAPGAGKSSISGKIAKKMGAAVIEADAVMPMLPEYNSGLNAEDVWGESSALTQQALNWLLKDGTNIVHERIGEDIEVLQKYVDRLRGQGYHVDVVHVRADFTTRMRRMAARFLETGRSIPIERMVNIGNRPSYVYTTAARLNIGDGFFEVESGKQGDRRYKILGRSGKPSPGTAKGVLSAAGGGVARAGRVLFGQRPSPRPRERALEYARLFRQWDETAGSGAAMANFGGAKAKGADLTALAAARKLAKDGVDANTIRHKTGWFRPKDGKGKWRFALASGQIDFLPKMGELIRSEKATSALLGDVITSPVFEQYPALKGARLYVGNYANAGGSNRFTQQLFISKNQARLPHSRLDVTNMIETLAHEIQHLISGIEHFERGGNANDIAKILETGKGWNANPPEWALKGAEIRYPGQTSVMSRALSLYLALADEIQARDSELMVNMSEAERAAFEPSIMTQDSIRAEDIQNAWDHLRSIPLKLLAAIPPTGFTIYQLAHLLTNYFTSQSFTPKDAFNLPDVIAAAAASSGAEQTGTGTQAAEGAGGTSREIPLQSGEVLNFRAVESNPSLREIHWDIRDTRGYGDDVEALMNAELAIRRRLDFTPGLRQTPEGADLQRQVSDLARRRLDAQASGGDQRGRQSYVPAFRAVERALIEELDANAGRGVTFMFWPDKAGLEPIYAAWARRFSHPNYRVEKAEIGYRIVPRGAEQTGRAATSVPDGGARGGEQRPAWFREGERVSAERLEEASGDAPFILEPEEYAHDWRIVRVPIDEIDGRGPVADTAERLQAVRDAPRLERPILRLSPNGRAEILDGYHRIEVAKERGATTVEALVSAPKLPTASNDFVHQEFGLTREQSASFDRLRVYPPVARAMDAIGLAGAPKKITREQYAKLRRALDAISDEDFITDEMSVAKRIMARRQVQQYLKDEKAFKAFLENGIMDGGFVGVDKPSAGPMESRRYTPPGGRFGATSSASGRAIIGDQPGFLDDAAYVAAQVAAKPTMKGIGGLTIQDKRMKGLKPWNVAFGKLDEVDKLVEGSLKAMWSGVFTNTPILNQIAGKASRYFQFGGVPDQAALEVYRSLFQGRVGKAEELAAEMARDVSRGLKISYSDAFKVLKGDMSGLAKLNKSVRAVAADQMYQLKKAMTEEDPAKQAGMIAALPPELQAAGTRAMTAIQEVGDALVEHRIISSRQRDKWNGHYLLRAYMEHFDSYKPPMGTRAGGAPYRAWREGIPKDKRLTKGEIEDLPFLLYMSIERPLHDIAAYTYLNSLIHHNQTAPSSPRWFLPESLVLFGGKWRSLFYIANQLKLSQTSLENKRAELASLGGTAASTPQAADLRTEVRALERVIADMKLVINTNPQYAQALNKGQLPDGYKQLPMETSKYGDAAGAVVIEQLYNDITGGEDSRADPDSVAGKAQEMYGDFNRNIKFLLTVANPPTHLRNMYSNILMLARSGTNPLRVIAAVKDIADHGFGKRTSPSVAAAIKFGSMKQTFTEAELRVLDEFARNLENEVKKAEFRKATTRIFGNNSVVDTALSAMDTANAIMGSIKNAYADGASWLYQMEDVIFKVAKIADELERGTPEALAALEARKYFFDYSAVTPAVRWLSNSAIAPFIRYTYFAVPNFLEQTVTSPWRLAYTGYGQYLGLMALASLMWGFAPEDAKKTLGEYLSERPMMVPVPWRDEHGRIQWIDLGYMLPEGALLGLYSAASRGNPWEALRAFGMTGGPLATIYAGVSTGVDPFRGVPISDETDDDQTRGLKLGWFVARSFMPSFYGYYLPALPGETKGGPGYEALWGTGEDRYGEPTQTGGQLISRGLGLNVYPNDVPYGQLKRVRQFRWELSRLEQDLNRAYSSQDLTPEARQRRIEYLTNRIDNVMTDYNEYVTATAEAVEAESRRQNE